MSIQNQQQNHHHYDYYQYYLLLSSPIFSLFTSMLKILFVISVQVTTEMSDLAGEQLLAEEQAAQAKADAKKAKKLRKKQKRRQAQQAPQHDEVR